MMMCLLPLLLAVPGSASRPPSILVRCLNMRLHAAPPCDAMRRHAAPTLPPPLNLHHAKQHHTHQTTQHCTHTATHQPKRSAQYNPIWEFGYQLNGRPAEMTFTSVAGHLMELEFAAPFKKWRACGPGDLYSAPVVKFVPQVRFCQGGGGCALKAGGPQQPRGGGRRERGGGGLFCLL